MRLVVGEFWCGIWVSGGQKSRKFYGMELSWVGAFTENGGIRYRNPVQILGVLAKNHAKLGFSGLV